MNNFGYEHPLLSFKLLPAGSVLDDKAAPYVIAVPEGLLTVSRRLLNRGALIDPDKFYEATLTVHSCHGTRVSFFSEYGLDAAWGESYGFWSERLAELDDERHGLIDVRDVEVRGRVHPVTWGQKLLGDLMFAARHAGLGDLLPAGRVPRRALLLRERLQLLAGEFAAPERARLLARYGFGPDQQQRLQFAIDAIAEHRQAGHAHRRDTKRLTAILAVLRGALLGDTIYLSSIARRYLSPQEAKPVLLCRLFPSRARKRRAARPGARTAGGDVSAGP